MITVTNYQDKIKAVKVDSLSAELREGHLYVNEYGDLYDDDKDIKEAIDLYLDKLNKTQSEKVAKPTRTFSYPPKPKTENSKPKTTDCQILDNTGKPDISPAAIEKFEACAEALPQTKEAHVTDKGNYTAERVKLHDAIIKEFKKDKPCVKQRQPVCILTGGPPGSGKTTWLKKYASWIKKENVYHIDADEVRAKLPEYKGWNATSTQAETKDIVNTLIDEIGEPCEFDMIYDGTMNKATSYDALIDKIRKLGYKIFIIYISVPKEVSQQRVLDRYRKRGRYVPRVVINEVYERGLAAFDKLTKEADGYIRVNGETGDIIEKGGMELPKSERYTDCDDCENEKQKPAPAKPAASKPEKESKEQREKRAAREIEKIGKGLRKIKTEDQVIKIGRSFHKRFRSTQAQARDPKTDAKKRLSPTPENLIRWMKHPGQFDLIGVDTFKATDATANYKRIISKQKIFNLFGIKI